MFVINGGSAMKIMPVSAKSSNYSLEKRANVHFKGCNVHFTDACMSGLAKIANESLDTNVKLSNMDLETLLSKFWKNITDLNHRYRDSKVNIALDLIQDTAEDRLHMVTARVGKPYSLNAKSMKELVLTDGSNLVKFVDEAVQEMK